MKSPLGVCAIALLAAVSGTAGAGTRCKPDAVAVGPVCVDRYEESVWSIPASQDKLIHALQSGKASVVTLTAGGASQLGAIPENGCTYTEYPDSFPATGNWTTPLYAVSLPGVMPSTCITWFQAEQACRLSGKRLLTNAPAGGTWVLPNPMQLRSSPWRPSQLVQVVAALTQPATSSQTFPAMSCTPQDETHAEREPVGVANGELVAQVVVRSSNAPASGVPAAAACHSSLVSSRFPDSRHACSAWNQVMHVLGITPGRETA